MSSKIIVYIHMWILRTNSFWLNWKGKWFFSYSLIINQFPCIVLQHNNYLTYNLLIMLIRIIFNWFWCIFGDKDHWTSTVVIDVKIISLHKWKKEKCKLKIYSGSQNIRLFFLMFVLLLSDFNMFSSSNSVFFNSMNHSLAFRMLQSNK